jgi:hypothetical protein
MRSRIASFLGLFVITVPLACSQTRCASSGHVLGTSVSVAASPKDRAALDAIEAERAAMRSMTAAELESRYALPFRDRIPYAPLEAKGLGVIESSDPLLSSNENARLARDGFVLRTGAQPPTFALAYADAFRKHLPVYISADSILFAVHKSFDALLKAIEMAVLVGDLGQVVAGMRAQLQDGRVAIASPEVAGDVDDYLAVASSLLEGKTEAPVLSGHAESVAAIVAHAMAADGPQDVALFGGSRSVDFSQFKPRGHYLGAPALERYFRAMMWLSRTDFRAIEVQPDGSQIFQRRQLAASLALRDLMSEPARAAWTRIDRTLEAFVGERDEMNVHDLDALARELGIAKNTELAGKSDDAIVATLARTGLGQQRIASQLAAGLPDASRPTPLHTSFALLNQRYTFDSHVLSNLSYDRVRSGKVPRMMPDPLDVGFAALANDGAAELLRGDLDRYEYAPELHMMRFLGTAQGDEYWQESLYSTWLSALRALSPTKDALDRPEAGGLPSVAATREWNARILSTQLASWAELRHDAVLYTKESYSFTALCEFPDAYVDPYPELFHRIALHARLGKALTADVLSVQAPLQNAAQNYFARLDEVATQLQQMAHQERAREPFTKAQMDFVNTMVSTHPSGGCGGPPVFSGWYGDLFVERAALTTFEPTITGVHTQPTDASGTVVGHVLHVGTGHPIEMVVTVDSGDGARAYAGYVSSYYETTTSNFERLDDEGWARSLQATPRPREPRWLDGLLPP